MKSNKNGRRSLVQIHKRIFLYLVRNMRKTIILLCLIVTISTFVLSCFSILRRTDILAEDMRNSVGGVFHIRGKPVKGEDDTIRNDAHLTDKNIEEIKKIKNVQLYNAKNTGHLKSENLEFIPGGIDVGVDNAGQILANSNTAYHESFREKELELIEGRHIDQKDKNVILMSEELAKYNGLKVGDTVRLSPVDLDIKNGMYQDTMADTAIKKKVKIIGIYKPIDLKEDYDKMATLSVTANKIYSDHQTMVDLGLAQKGQYTGEVSLFIKDPDKMGENINQMKQIGSVEWEKFSIREEKHLFEKIQVGLESIQNLIRMLLLGAGSISVVVLLLILAMRIRSRMKESGILLSLGFTKKQIVLQMLSEIAIISVVGFLIAVLLSGATAGIIEELLFRNLQVDMLNNVTKIHTFLNMSALELGLLLLALLTVIILSTMLLLSTIIKLKPREIFAKLS